ncbi:hypothetical protein R5R35_001762 [Gryllus longicercus]|uniref:Guanine deaminase n=1 Tax=Gryllus longicercus TaxID=2509291 RepID=A0AAN9ZF09_9ORTH
MEQWNLETSEPFAVMGTVVHSHHSKSINILQNHVIIVHDGKIQHIGMAPSLQELKEVHNISERQIIQLSPSQFIMPGLIDTHIHAPQYPNAGLGYDKTLLEWLETYTFPLEKQYGDLVHAQNVYKHVVRHSLNSGTTTACYFATIHLESSLLLVDLMTELGQRGFVGKVNMNTCQNKGYNEKTEQSVTDTEIFIKNVLQRKNQLVQPIITPRFALSCDSILMKKLGELAKKYNVHIQTHISENLGEIEAVKEIFPDSKHYADVYDKAELLTKKTVLAHGVWLKDEEIKLLVSRGSSVSHCPCSNTNLQSGLCNVRRLLEAGVKVGLGTDVSGGHTPSILDVMHSALDTSIHVFFQHKNIIPLTYHEVFYLATLGGAEALALENEVGNLMPGKQFDALIVDMSSHYLLNSEPETLVQKFVYCGDDRNIISVFVGGKIVKKTKI